MHGITDNPMERQGRTVSVFGQIRTFLWERRTFLLIVVAPTLLLVAYYTLFAADQYESEAHFAVRSSEPGRQVPSGLGQALSLVSGGGNPAEGDGLTVSDYLASHEAVASLRKNDDLVARFRRPEADIFSRLWPTNPTPETLLHYYQDHVQVKLDTDTNLIVLKVQAFRPQDSYAIADALLKLGERRVNMLNERMYTAALGQARRQLDEAEDAVTQAQLNVTAFRQQNRNIDPVATGTAQIELVGKLQGLLAQARAQRAALVGVSADGLQARALDARVRGLAAEVGAAQGELVGSSGAIAAKVGKYQELQLRAQFAAKRYEAAAAQFQSARTDLEKQQLFVVRMVDPNMPVKSTYPKSLKIIGTVFLGLLLCYGIGWLIAAGVREHAA